MVVVVVEGDECLLLTVGVTTYPRSTYHTLCYLTITRVGVGEGLSIGHADMSRSTSINSKQISGYFFLC